MRAKAIFVGGTASHAGKSWMVTAICRHLKNRGLRVAPFKAQNMSNNSYPCAAGGEIGRAQVAQAEACGLEPEPDMNPVLIKPLADTASQVVVNGRPIGNFAARDYYLPERSAALRQAACDAYDRLASRFDYIVLEGAGSVAEVNLLPRDFVNLAMAEHAEARALLISDIDRGGVFASICGTLDLLPPAHRALMRAFAVNRFRGDPSLFIDGVAFLEQRTGVPCIGVFPMARDIHVDAEDAVTMDDLPALRESRIAAIALPRISNLTDFRHVPCRWIHRPEQRQFDWIILPGTKNTLGDLDWLRAQGLDEWILAAHRGGARILGICGGYQMLGLSVDDPYCVESAGPISRSGLGLLPVRTVLEPQKLTRAITARTPAGAPFGAYEIHCGVTTAHSPLPPFAHLADGSPEGARCGSVTGTYLHGALESPAVIHELFGLRVDALPAHENLDRLDRWFASAANLRLFEEVYL